MKMKFDNRLLFWLIFIVYVGLLILITEQEKNHPNANIRNLYDALWYSVVTLTTVGYGDYFPVSPLGKILGLFIILSSLGLLGYLIGNATNKIRDYMEKKKEGFFGTSFINHFVIIGWNNFARQVVDQIYHANYKIAIVTDNKNDIDTIGEFYKSENVFVLFSDFTNYENYARVNIVRARSVFINLEDDTDTLVFLINMKKNYPNVSYVVSLNKPDLKETFLSLGVQNAVSRNEIASKLVASYIFEPYVGQLTEDLIATSVNENDFDIQQYKVKQSNPFIGNDYIDAYIHLKKEYDAVLIGITKNNNGEPKLLTNPNGHVTIEQDDYLLLISNGTAKKTLEKSFGVQEGVSD